MNPPIPQFALHEDPVRSGSVAATPGHCLACERERPATYVGPVYAEADLEAALCPWCLADGTAHARFGAEFFDAELLPDGAPPARIEEALTRTPGFHAWQGVEWPLCCGDLTTFLEPAGADLVGARYRIVEGQLLAHIVHDLGISGRAAHALLGALDRDRGPTAYLFRCARCGTHHARIDRP